MWAEHTVGCSGVKDKVYKCYLCEEVFTSKWQRRRHNLKCVSLHFCFVDSQNQILLCPRGEIIIFQSFSRKISNRITSSACKIGDYFIRYRSMRCEYR